MLSLESMAGWLIESPYGSIFESPPLAGHIYHRAGALYAGQTKSGAQPTRYVDPTTQQIKSVYRAGHNTISELRQEGIPLIDDGPKHRFVFITGVAPGSLEYAACRAALPDWVREYEWGEHGLGWIQPRLLVALLETLPTWLAMRLGQRVQPSQNQS
jgi:hypothetical protein